MRRYEQIFGRKDKDKHLRRHSKKKSQLYKDTKLMDTKTDGLFDEETVDTRAGPKPRHKKKAKPESTSNCPGAKISRAVVAASTAQRKTKRP